VCDRTTCPQRAFPALGKPLDPNPHHGSFIPYATGDSVLARLEPPAFRGSPS
jgi:hypothetical protein